MKKTSQPSRGGDERYHYIFENSAVCLWEEDISRLRSRLSSLRKDGSHHLHDYLGAHPEFAQEAAHLIEVTAVNQSSLRLFEAERKEQLLGPLDIVLDTVSRTAFTETLLAIDEGRSDVEAESTARTLKGNTLSVIVKSHIPPSDTAGVPMLVSIIDITERKRAEERERRGAIILHSLIDSSPDMIFVKDTSLRMVLCNTALARAIGKEPQETYGKSDIENGWSVDLVKGNAEKGIAGWEKDDLAVLSGKTVQIADEPSDFDKGIRYFDTVKFPLRDVSGAVTGLIGIGRDITERRKAEHELRKAKEFAENLIRTANVIVLGLDVQNRVTIFNKAAQEITGYTRQEMMNRPWFETAVPRERYPDVWKFWEKFTREGGTGTFENPILTKSGEERYIVWQNSQTTEDGRPAGTLSFGIDITDRRRIEQDLAWQKSLFDTLMEHLPDYIYFKDLKSRFIRTSWSHARILGLRDPSEAVGKTDADFYRADHALKALEDEQEIIRTGKPLMDMEERETYSDRPDTWAITTKMPFRNVQGEIIGTFGITRDITERKRVELALTWERSLFDMLMNNLPDRIYFKDTSSRFLRTSRSHAKERGLSNPLEEAGKTDADFSSPEHSRKAYEDEQMIIRTGMPIVNMEEKVSFPGKPDIWFITTKMPLIGPAGEIVGTFGISHDITGRRQLEAKNQLLATLVESAKDAIVGLDLDEKITVWNKGAERLHGYSAEEMIGVAISKLLPPDLEGARRTLGERLKGGEQISHFETISLRKDGSRVCISLSLSPIRDAHDRIVGIASVARDVTEQKALQVQLGRAQRLESLATLAGGVAHQFNNINTVIRGYLQLMQSESELPARLASYLEAANAGVQKAVDITDRLLALTEPGGSSNTLRLDLLAHTLLAFHEKSIEREGIRLVRDIGETPLVQGNEVRLKFVLSSLIVNAIDSLLDRPVRTMSVRTGSTKDAAWFEVEDSGCGIPEENLPRIFSPFFSAKGVWAPPGSPQARLKGVGLSLAISSSTVSEYGGRIDVQSTKGTGSTFRVLLPLARRPGPL